MIDKELAELLATRRSEQLKAKDNIWKLIRRAYKGGDDWIGKDTLVQYRIEDDVRYNQRLARADYTNHTQQLIDMIVGFVYQNPVKRNITGYDYILSDIYKGKSMQSLMNMVATNCLKGTIGVLVDSPSVEVSTQAERVDNGVNPYVVVYTPDMICDFELSDKGTIEWVLLDNSYTDKIDPLTPPTKVIMRRLWTKTYYRDIETIPGQRNKYKLYEEVAHNLGEVPFILVNSRDVDGDFICDSPFEDIVLKSRTVFNISSWATEVLASSSFQLLLFPYDNQQDLDNIAATFDPATGGIGDLPVVPFKATSQRPSFEAPDISIDKFILMINHISSEILAKFGMKIEEKGSWESGVAKSIDFAKTEAFLRSISIQLEDCERKIVYYCGLWENKDITAEIDYSMTYEKGDIERQLLRLEKLFNIPSDKVKKAAYSEAIRLTFPDVTEKTISELTADISATPPSMGQ